RRLGVRLLPAHDPVTPFAALFFWGRVTTSISVLRRSAYERAGGFSEDQGFHAEDIALWLRVALTGTIHYIPEPLVLRRIHPMNHGRRVNARSQEIRLFPRWLAAEWLTDE